MNFKKLFYSCILSFTAVVQSWTVNHGNIYDNNGKVYNMSGISWFGFETQDFVINGLWSHPMEFYLDIIKQYKFNTIRVPFSSEWIYYNWDLYPYEGLVASDPNCARKTSIQILDRLFDLAEERKINIMFDLHRLHKEYISELWYSPTDNMFTSDSFFSTWFAILDRYSSRSNLIAIDLLNEPHGRATWGNSNPDTDWNKFAENAIAKFYERYPQNKWLFLVEGVGWGKDLSQAGKFPIKMPKGKESHLSYSAHCYGKSVVSTVDVNNQYALYQDWNNNFGYLSSLEKTYIIGEYGGITDIDGRWMQIFIEYLVNNNMNNAFFWSLGPNSGDVHGFLLDDWTTVDQFKADITRQLQPNPTF